MRAMFLLMLVFLIAFVFISLIATQAESFRGFAFILIGPFPLFIDTSNPAAMTFLLAIIPLALLAFLLLLARRNTESE